MSIQVCEANCKCHKQANKSALQQTEKIINTDSSISDRREALTNLKCSSGNQVWTRNSYRSLSIRFPWEDDSSRLFVHRTHTFHNFCINSRLVRMDGVRYMREDTEHIGVVNSVLQMRRVKCQKFFLVRKMMPVEPDDGKRKVVECFGNINLSFELGEEGYVQSTCLWTVYDYRGQLQVRPGIR